MARIVLYMIKKLTEAKIAKTTESTIEQVKSYDTKVSVEDNAISEKTLQPHEAQCLSSESHPQAALTKSSDETFDHSMTKSCRPFEVPIETKLLCAALSQPQALNTFPHK